MVTETEAFSHWIITVKHKPTQGLIAGLFRRPYLDDLAREDLDTFYESTFKLIDADVPTKAQPVGIPVAFIKSLPTISLPSHSYWKQRWFLLQKSTSTNSENATVQVYNICEPDDIKSAEFRAWADTSMHEHVTSKEVLAKYLCYAKFQAAFTNDFLIHFFEWKLEDTDKFKYLLLLMKDVELHPFTGGMGKTENLKYRGKEASKRVTQVDRLSYSISNNIVTFMACKGHYDFH